MLGGWTVQTGGARLLPNPLPASPVQAFLWRQGVFLSRFISFNVADRMSQPRPRRVRQTWMRRKRSEAAGGDPTCSGALGRGAADVVNKPSPELDFLPHGLVSLKS